MGQMLGCPTLFQIESSTFEEFGFLGRPSTGSIDEGARVDEHVEGLAASNRPWARRVRTTQKRVGKDALPTRVCLLRFVSKRRFPRIAQ